MNIKNRRIFHVLLSHIDFLAKVINEPYKKNAYLPTKNKCLFSLKNSKHVFIFISQVL